MKRNAAPLYAKAYLNTFGSGITQDNVHAIEQASQFLFEHRRALFLLKVPTMQEAVKKRGVQELADRFALPESIGILFDLLLQRKSASLLADILHAIAVEYNRRHDHHKVEIASSSVLTEPQKKAIMKFADAQFPGTKEYIFAVDTSLIAGIKIKSNTLMLESSVDNYLRECAQAQIR